MNCSMCQSQITGTIVIDCRPDSTRAYCTSCAANAPVPEILGERARLRGLAQTLESDPLFAACTLTSRIIGVAADPFPSKRGVL